jgi:hypothetical protein
MRRQADGAVAQATAPAAAALSLFILNVTDRLSRFHWLFACFCELGIEGGLLFRDDLRLHEVVVE